MRKLAASKSLWIWNDKGTNLFTISEFRIQTGSTPSPYQPAPEDYTIKRDGQAYTAGAAITPTDTINWTLHEPTTGKEIDRKSTIFSEEIEIGGENLVRNFNSWGVAKLNPDSTVTVTSEREVTIYNKSLKTAFTSNSFSRNGTYTFSVTVRTTSAVRIYIDPTITVVSSNYEQYRNNNLEFDLPANFNSRTSIVAKGSIRVCLEIFEIKY